MGDEVTAVRLTDELVGTIGIGRRTVRRFGYGAMRITGDGIWGPPPDHDGAIAVLRRAVELGVNLIDTADSYVVIATKGGLTRSGPGRWSPDVRPEHLKQACEGSLRRLRLDAIELYQLHRPDPKVPYEVSVGALKELQDEGKIRNVGVSNVSLDQLETAREIVEVVSVQNRFNLADRSSEDVLERCEELGIAFFPWFPLAAGDLAKPGAAVEQIASRHGASPGQVALAWLLKRSPVILPIPGTSSVEHLEQDLAAASLQLSDDELVELESAAG